MDLRKEIFLLAQQELKVGNVLLELATGVGKTKLGLDLAEDRGAKNVTVLVPTNAVGEAWIAEVKKWNSNLFVTTVNYASAHKVLELLIPPDLVIMDEAHHITERNIEFIALYKCPLIALSATVDWEKMQLLQAIGFKRGISVGLDKATDHDLIAPYEMFIIKFTPDGTRKLIQAGTKEKSWWTTEKASLAYAETRIDKAKQSHNSQSIQFAYLNRMRLIRTLPTRIETAKRLLTRLRTKFPESKILVFAPTIEDCESIVPECYYHSKSDDSGFEAFKNGTQQTLGSVNALSEGINVHADIALIVAGMSKERHTVQRLGRLLRKTAEGKMGKAFLLVAEGTQDETWAEESTGGLSNVKYYKTSDLGL
jgi:superfamily II DNA or RNA helicase